jgi:hypothetical protein
VRDDDLLPATQARLARAQEGQEVVRRLTVAALEPGQNGVLEVEVRAIAPARTFSRTRGGDGLLQRVTLADDSGEVDLVLWDDETRQTRDGVFRPGALLRLRGASVKSGHKSGVELGLGSAVVEVLPAPSGTTLVGTLLGVGEVRPVGTGAQLRFNAEVRLETPGGPVDATCWDGALKAVRGLPPGTPLRIEGAHPNPLLPGRWTVPAEARVLPGGTAK